MQRIKCALCRAWFGVPVRFFFARLRALRYCDTRLYSLFSGLLTLVWLAGLDMDHSANALVSSMEKVLYYIPSAYLYSILIPLACGEVLAVVYNNYNGRKFSSFMSLNWWCWLAILMFQTPTNIGAVLTFSVVAAFRAWTFVTLTVIGDYQDGCPS